MSYNLKCPFIIIIPNNIEFQGKKSTSANTVIKPKTLRKIMYFTNAEKSIAKTIIPKQ